MFTHRILSDSKSPQVCRTILIMQVDLNNAVVWIVCTRSVISKSSSSWTNTWSLCQQHQLLLVSPSLSYSTVFFNSLARSKYPSFFSLSFNFILYSVDTTKFYNLASCFFFCCWLSLGLVIWPRFGDTLISHLYFLKIFRRTCSW